MDGWRKVAVAGAVSVAAVCAAPAADAGIVVLTQTPGATVDGLSLFGVGGGYTGRFDLTPYLSDGQGRTFSVTAATISAHARSDPNYGAPVTTTSDVLTGETVTLGAPPALVFDVTHTTTTTYTDSLADGLTFGLGGGFLPTQTASGRVTGVLDSTDTQDLGTTDGPITFFPFGTLPGTQHTDNVLVTVRHALYGALDLSIGFNADNLAAANLGEVDFSASAGTPDSGGGIPGFPPGFPGIPGFPGFPGIPDLPLPDGSSFILDSVSLSLDLTQTGGPPPPTAGAPEPAQWTLMLAGFGLLGAVVRRRRSLAVAT